MTNKEVLILLCSSLSVGERHKPFSNLEINKIILKLKEKDLELKDLYDMNETQLFNCFFADESKNDKNVLFIKRITSLLSRLGSMAFVRSELSNMGIKILTIYDKEYPESFKKHLGSKTPSLLYYAGNLELLKHEFIGFSGSRLKKTDKADETLTRNWAREVLKHNYGIISGGANGVDTFATQEAIENNYEFIEFLSNSLVQRLKIVKISKAIQEGRGLLLSEVKPDAPFNAGFAMARNKYIYLLARKVIVIKAQYTIKGGKKTGGTWNGAIENIKSNYKNVYCIDYPKIKGNKELIELGAILIHYDINKETINRFFKDDNNVNEKIIDPHELKLISVIKSKDFLKDLKLTEKELNNLAIIKEAIAKLESSISELTLSNSLVNKIKKHAEKEINKPKFIQPSLFEEL